MKEYGYIINALRLFRVLYIHRYTLVRRCSDKASRRIAYKWARGLERGNRTARPSWQYRRRGPLAAQEKSFFSGVFPGAGQSFILQLSDQTGISEPGVIISVSRLADELISPSRSLSLTYFVRYHWPALPCPYLSSAVLHFRRILPAMTPLPILRVSWYKIIDHVTTMLFSREQDNFSVVSHSILKTILCRQFTEITGLIWLSMIRWRQLWKRTR